MKTIYVIICALAIFCKAELATAQSIISTVLSNGAVNSYDKNTTLRGSLGQSIIGVVSSRTEAKTEQGFWYTIGTGLPSNSVEETRSTASTFSVSNIFPNPISSKGELKVTLTEGSYLQIELYDMLGNKVLSVFQGHREVGDYKFQLDANDVQNGNYAVLIRSGKAIAKEFITITK